MPLSIRRQLAGLLHAVGRRDVLFLHTQKTAGTTLISLAYKRYGTSIVSHGDYMKMTSKQMSRKAFISGHFGFDYASQYMDNRYSLTFLRNPVDRLVSLYYFCLSEDPAQYPIYKAAQSMDFKDFLIMASTDPIISGHVKDHQVWQLACGWANRKSRSPADFGEDELLEKAALNLDAFSYVGFTERFEEDKEVICSELKLPCRDDAEVINSSVRPALDEITSDERALAEELTTLDRKLYERAWNRYASAG